MSQLLQGWSPQATSTQPALPVATTRPVRGPTSEQTTTMGPAPAPRWSATRALPRVPRWQFVLALTMVLIFPHLFALLLASAVRLLLRGATHLLANVVKEIYAQTMLTATELEDQLMFWLHSQLGIYEPSHFVAAPGLPTQPSSSTSAPPYTAPNKHFDCTCAQYRA